MKLRKPSKELIGGVKMEGSVKWFNRQKGYGFIAGDDGQEYFVHHTALDRGTFIRDNDKVSFDPDKGERGPVSKNVKLLQKGSEIAKDEGAEPSEESSEEPQEAEEPEEEPVEEPVEEPEAEETKAKK